MSQSNSGNIVAIVVIVSIVGLGIVGFSILSSMDLKNTSSVELKITGFEIETNGNLFNSLVYDDYGNPKYVYPDGTKHNSPAPEMYVYAEMTVGFEKKYLFIQKYIYLGNSSIKNTYTKDVPDSLIFSKGDSSDVSIFIRASCYEPIIGEDGNIMPAYEFDTLIDCFNDPNSISGVRVDISSNFSERIYGDRKPLCIFTLEGKVS